MDHDRLHRGRRPARLPGCGRDRHLRQRPVVSVGLVDLGTVGSAGDHPGRRRDAPELPALGAARRQVSGPRRQVDHRRADRCPRRLDGSGLIQPGASVTGDPSRRRSRPTRKIARSTTFTPLPAAYASGIETIPVIGASAWATAMIVAKPATEAMTWSSVLWVAYSPRDRG